MRVPPAQSCRLRRSTWLGWALGESNLNSEPFEVPQHSSETLLFLKVWDCLHMGRWLWLHRDVFPSLKLWLLFDEWRRRQVPPDPYNAVVCLCHQWLSVVSVTNTHALITSKVILTPAGASVAMWDTPFISWILALPGRNPHFSASLGRVANQSYKREAVVSPLPGAKWVFVEEDVSRLVELQSESTSAWGAVIEGTPGKQATSGVRWKAAQLHGQNCA